MECVNDVKTNFNQQQKAAQRLIEHQVDDGITNDHVKTLKQHIPTRWHSKLGAIMIYLSQSAAIKR